jgi:hypothetical protein
VLAVGKHLVLARQVGTTGVDQVDARQVVLLRDRLGAKMLLDREGVVGAAFHGRVVGDDHALAAADASDAGDDAGSGNLFVAVYLVGGELPDLEKRRAGVEERVDALARQQLAALAMPLPRAPRRRAGSSTPAP